LGTDDVEEGMATKLAEQASEELGDATMLKVGNALQRDKGMERRWTLARASLGKNGGEEVH
jgi:hypothetical protein